MAMDLQDQTAPIKREDISAVIDKAHYQSKLELVATLMGFLNEKRDSYNGVISSLIYTIDSGDDELVNALKEILQEYIGADPMRYGGKVFVTRCLTRLTAERPHFIADLFARFIKDEYRQWEGRISSHSEILRIKIIALKAIGQVEQKTRVKMTDIPNEMIDSICDDAVAQGDETTKIDTLYIVLDTKQATRVLVDRELKIFQAIFKEILGLQIPALRQKFLAITNKLLKRLRDSIRVVCREKLRFSDEDRDVIRARYMNFLEWLIMVCLDNIYCNKYFGSFVITMTTLSYIIEHITPNNSNLPVAAFLQNRRFYDSILSCLALDSFEDNKIMALKLLFALPSADPKIFETNLDLFEKISYELVKSVNPAHTLTCQYIFKLMIGARQNHLKVRKSDLVFEHLDKLVKLVEDGVRETKENFITAMKSSPIYPKLTCIRALLAEIRMEELEDNRARWSELAERLINASIESCEAVSSIVCNMNPETIGHLPMDLEPIDTKILSMNSSSSPVDSANNLDTITSQHLLITGWKTIKECSLSMGSMCSIFWWPENQRAGSKPILESQSIKAILKFFEHYLRNLRHRGAFEQAYNGFVMVTKRLWLDPTFRIMLIDLLNQTMRDFRCDQNELSDQKVDYLTRHVTRRSAGLPFLVQAIAVSEHRNESEIFQSIMDTLIFVNNSPESEAYQKIHCLNIIKALVNDFNLGDKVTPYIGRILLITINSFRSDDFRIRNCANMLMRALVDRTFGVSRLRDDIHKRNTISYEKFFTDYPELHGKFLEILENGLKDKKLFAAVHAVFIVLFRLRPSLNASEEYTVTKLVGSYMGPLYKLMLTCPDYRLRELAAELFVQIDIHTHHGQDGLTTNSWNLDLIKGIESLSKPGRSWEDIPFNALHGILSVMRALVKHLIVSNSKPINKDLFDDLNDLLNKKIFSESTETMAGLPMIYNAAFDLAERRCLSPSLRYLPSYHHILEDWRLKCELYDGSSQPRGIDFIGPMSENFIFRAHSVLLSNSPQAEYYKNMIDYITRKPNRLIGVNLQAGLIRLLRQYWSRSNDFVDKLMANLDLDSTAPFMTPCDRLDQCSEQDTEKELWLKYCNEARAKNLDIVDSHQSQYISNLSNKLFDLSNYMEFDVLQHPELCNINIPVLNSPRAIELLGLVLKVWPKFNLEQRCIWSHRGETISDKLGLLNRFLKFLPNCDIKHFVLLCASKYAGIQMRQIHQLCVSKEGNQESEIYLEDQTMVVNQFTQIIDELAGSEHDRMTRETCTEILHANLKTALQCWCTPLKEAQINLISTLIKLCQDQECQIRNVSLNVISDLGLSYPQQTPVANNDEIGFLIKLISIQFLNPHNRGDVMKLFDLLARIIFNHTRTSLFDVNLERESLFDKTKPNIFADHIATIQNALSAADAFFKQCDRESVDSIDLSPEILAELLTADTLEQVDHTIGDYSWRLKGGHPATPSNGSVDKRAAIDNALANIKEGLKYFNHWNMLTDTSFGYHESSTFKKLAFIKLLIKTTDYENDTLIEEVRNELNKTITSSCATTILFKCYELFGDGGH